MYKIPLTLILIMFLSACGGSSGGGSSELQGVFLDSAVEGVRYTTNSKSGTTDANGTFTYLAGETVNFYIGDILLGSAAAKATMTPVDLVSGATDETNPQVTNIVRFLLTLDSDSNFSNGIQIDSSVISAAASQSVDFSLSIAAFENDSSILSVLNFLTQGLPGGSRPITSVTDAQAHFRNTLNGITSGGTNVANGNFGTLSISGTDTAVIGSSFSPNVAVADTRPSVINPSATNTSLIWSSNSGLAFSATATSMTMNASIINGSLAQVLFTVVTPGSSQTFSYILICALTPTECNKLAIDLNAKTANFNNVQFNASNVASETGPINLNNTLTWQ